MVLTVVMVGMIFLTLKLIGIGLPSEWSWWVVLLPWYGPPAFLFLLWVSFMILGFAFGMLATFVGNYGRKLRQKEKERLNRAKRCNKCGEFYVGLAQDCGCTRGSC